MCHQQAASKKSAPESAQVSGYPRPSDMRPNVLLRLICQHRHRALACGADTVGVNDEVIPVELRCEGCVRVYPVTHGIPRFVPCENYASSFGYQWTRFRQEQMDSLNGTRQSEHRLRTETGWTP